jgi:hypothetical protein
LRNGGGRAGRRGLSSNNKLGFVDESLFVERFCFRQPKFWRPKKGQKKAGDSLLKVLEKEEERKKERRKEGGGDLYRKNKFGFEIPTKKKDWFKIFRVWERTESAREHKAFEEGIEEIIRLRERDHKEVQGFWGRRFCKRGGI